MMCMMDATCMGLSAAVCFSKHWKVFFLGRVPQYFSSHIWKFCLCYSGTCAHL